MKNRIYNITILSLIVIIISFLSFKCISYKKEIIELSKGPEIIWKEYRTTEYVPQIVYKDKIVYKNKIVYKDKICSNYEYDDGALVVSIK